MSAGQRASLAVVPSPMSGLPWRPPTGTVGVERSRVKSVAALRLPAAGDAEIGGEGADPHAVRVEDGAFLIAATISPDPDPHREMDLIAWVNGMSTRCTRSRLRI
jgi:hypothetical protein